MHEPPDIADGFAPVGLIVLKDRGLPLGPNGLSLTLLALGECLVVLDDRIVRR
jgi:hypothetical protein